MTKKRYRTFCFAQARKCGNKSRFEAGNRSRICTIRRRRRCCCCRCSAERIPSAGRRPVTDTMAACLTTRRRPFSDNASCCLRKPRGGFPACDVCASGVSIFKDYSLETTLVVFLRLLFNCCYWFK